MEKKDNTIAENTCSNYRGIISVTISIKVFDEYRKARQNKIVVH
jgi:hypothetical protein